MDELIGRPIGSDQFLVQHSLQILLQAAADDLIAALTHPVAGELRRLQETSRSFNTGDRGGNAVAMHSGKGVDAGVAELLLGQGDDNRQPVILYDSSPDFTVPSVL